MRLARAALAAVVLAVSTSLLAAPCGSFTDVDDANPAYAPFCASVEWIKSRNITLGCAGTLYCPNATVTRLQMAAFLYRLGFQNAFLQGGNAFGTTAALGTTDNQPVDLRANNARVMRYEPNPISPNVIGGNPANAATAGVRGATISGGGTTPGNTDPTFDFEGPNLVTDAYGTVGGGYNNRAGNNAGTVVDAPFATVAGGGFNEASASYATVGGGSGNEAQRSYATVAGGELNFAQGEHGSIGGGKANLVSNVGFATVAGGFTNWANAAYATIGGGANNTASGAGSAIGGGSGNWARGLEATVPGGDLNEANGAYSVAMGRRAIVNGMGSFLFADGSDEFVPVISNSPNEFAVAATGGIAMGTTRTFSNVCRLAPGGGSWACVSDRHVKQDFAAVDVQSILHKVVALPITTWRFKTQPETVRHLGPMSQDFRTAFGLGTDDKTITQVDINGVALAAIQGLNAKLEAERAAKDAEIAALRAELAAIRSVLATIAGARPTQTAVVGP